MRPPSTRGVKHSDQTIAKIPGAKTSAAATAVLSQPRRIWLSASFPAELPPYHWLQSGGKPRFEIVSIASRRLLRARLVRVVHRTRGSHQGGLVRKRASRRARYLILLVGKPGATLAFRRGNLRFRCSFVLFFIGAPFGVRNDDMLSASRSRRNAMRLIALTRSRRTSTKI